MVDSGYDVQRDEKRELTKFGFKDVSMGEIVEFFDKIEVSPKNEQFNIAAIQKFIKGYRGKELSKWDISFATGKSSKPVNLGQGIEYCHPTRKFTIENNGKILKMSGSKRRLGTASDGAYGLTAKQLEDIREGTDLQNIPQKNYFIGVDRNPLLTIYMVELGDCLPGKEDVRDAYEKCSNQIVVGFCLGIPSLSDNETKYARYILNKVAIQQIFEGEADWDDDEAEENLG